MMRLSFVWPLVFFALGCVENVAPTMPTIHRVDPLPIQPGAEVRVSGALFGTTGHMAIGPRHLVIVEWQNDEIVGLAPTDLPPGQGVLSVVAEGRPAEPYPVEVTGLQRAIADTDGRPPSPGPETPDAGPEPIVLDPTLSVTFTADPGGRDEVRLRALPAPPGELWVDVSGPTAWGAAFHLTYDPNLLQVISADPNGNRRAHGDEIIAGRWAYGRLLDPNPEAPYVVLRFALVGPGEGRLDLPIRHRGLRTGDNQPLGPVPWRGGSIRIQRTQ